MRRDLLILVIFVILSIWITEVSFVGYSKIYAQEFVTKDSFLGLKLSAIDLSEEQKEELEVLKLNFQVEVQDIIEKLKRKAPQIRTLWESYPPDAEEIVAKQKEIDSLQSQLQEKSIVYRVKAIKILTEEQFKKISALQEEQPPLRLGR